MTTSQKLRLGTRSSMLARWQADWVSVGLAERGGEVELVVISTGGDVDSRPIGSIGGQGVFTKEIQRALIEERIDLAVHSLKDLPTDSVDGLMLAAVPERASPHDVLVGPAGNAIEELTAAARVGTGSLRRRSQLLYRRQDLEVDGIRGNVDTRLRKLDSGQFDAIVLAEAGLQRLGLQHRISKVLPFDDMMPAVGQGALGLECRTDDARTRSFLEQLDDPFTHACVVAERALLAKLHGGCSAPIGACCYPSEEGLELRAVVLDVDGKRRLDAGATASLERPVDAAEAVAEELLTAGAQQLIASARG